MIRHCALCNSIIPWRSDGLCHRCYKQYKDYKEEHGEYPPWLRFLIADDQHYNKYVLLKEKSLVSQYGLLEDLYDQEDSAKDY